MGEKQTTTNCHIIPKRYIKNFLNEDWKIFYADRYNWWEILEADKDFLFASKKNTYNYFDDKKKIINDEFENYLSEKEGRVSKIANKLLIQFNEWIQQEFFELNKNHKENIIQIFMLLYEKIFYHHMQNTFSKNEKQVAYEEDLWAVFSHLNWMTCSFYCLFHILLLDEFQRSLIYSKNGNFYFWDIPFHISSWWKYVQFPQIFNTHGASILFPLSKNFIIYIEYKKRNKNYLSLYSLESNNFKVWLYSDISERITVNCTDYIAWPDIKYLRYLLNNRNNFKRFGPDIIFYQKQYILPKESNFLKKEFEKFKNINYWLTKIHLMNIKNEFFEKFKSIDSEFSKPCNVENCIKILTWWDDDKIKKVLKEKRYIEIFRNSKENLMAINEHFEI